jgi:RNA polymerase sigma-70 factor (ECF subfamily)
VNELTDYKASNIEDLIIKTSEVHELLSKLIKINPDYADILTLKFYHDFNDKEIAQLLNISHENARVRLFRAKAALKKIIGSERSKDLVVEGMCENEGSF